MYHYTPRSLASLVTAFLPLTLVFAAPSPVVHNKRETTPAQEFEITALSGRFPSTGPYGTGPINSSLQITVSYPSGDDTLTTTCSYNWPASTAPGPTDWTVCEDPSVQWRLPADGWSNVGNYRVQVYESLSDDGAGLVAEHTLTMSPGNPSDPNAYLSCFSMGKFTPNVCSIDGPLSSQHGPVVMEASEVAERPS